MPLKVEESSTQTLLKFFHVLALSPNLHLLQGTHLELGGRWEGLGECQRIFHTLFTGSTLKEPILACEAPAATLSQFPMEGSLVLFHSPLVWASPGHPSTCTHYSTMPSWLSTVGLGSTEIQSCLNSGLGTLMYSSEALVSEDQSPQTSRFLLSIQPVPAPREGVQRCEGSKEGEIDMHFKAILPQKYLYLVGNGY